ncbi:cardiolipin synthase [Bacteroidales bacterium OttesenSCG-928-C03]|nr:cardiolipin synthase [Bacteroidales bacterium OttesenSCG-928-E04]MDL2308133.1 cardiolipin synthase [Bacteroidales bacterium OttesenSCG-928-C03]MDL2325559.1 cardiolipin synthase [Bacteroidales bacterium OttesenSCG-928-A14]
MGSLLTSILSILFLLLIISTMIVILTGNSNNEHTTTWLIVVMVFPLIGLILYYIFGYNPRRRGEYKKNYLKFLDKFFEIASPELIHKMITKDDRSKIRSQYSKLADLLTQSNDASVIAGNDIEIITSGQRKLESLIEDISNAQHHIHFEYFYFRRDENCRRIRDLLMQKAKEGVQVRFIYENIANIDISPRYYKKMCEAGVEVLPFTKTGLPWIRRQLNYRDHRKIVVIDGNIGYTGGMNIGDDYFVKWRDTHLRITGNGVAGLQYCFLHAWFESGGKLPEDLNSCFPFHENNYEPNLLQIVPDAPDSRWPFLLLGNMWAVENARSYIYIQTPYYLPPDGLFQTLKSAALSGVDVRIMLSHKSDFFFMDWATQSYYEESLRAGIRILELQDSFSHAKSIMVDDYLSIMGSANMDFRSLDLSFEINTYIYDEKITLQNKAIFFEDCESCKEITLENWLKRPWYIKLLQSFMRLLAPLL